MVFEGPILTSVSYIASSGSESVSLAQPMDTSPFVLGLRKAAKESALAINVGIHAPASGGKLSNRSCWINEKGEIEAYYDKLHLFDYGNLKESDSVAGGKSILPPINTVVGRVGLTICFDVMSLPRILVSFSDMVIAAVSRDWVSSEASRCSNYHVPFSIYNSYWSGTLGSPLEIKSNRNTGVCYCRRSGWFP